MLEYLEDPIADLAGMAAVRARTDVPLATNMCVVAAEHLAPAVQLGAVDVVLADPHYWGGFRANRRMMAVCSAFGLAVGMHSDNDLGSRHRREAAPRGRLAGGRARRSTRTHRSTRRPARGAAARRRRRTSRCRPGRASGVELDPELVARYRVA